ncbi:unnamed protein product [Heterobilharzia americana]|nr:unnamed protein product [Heterobilharzia americana]
MNASFQQDKWNQKECVTDPCLRKPSGNKRNHLHFEDDPKACKKRKLSSEKNSVSTINSKLASHEFILTNGYSKQLSKHPSLKGDYKAVKITSSQSHVITIHETYQLGFMDQSDSNKEKKLYVFDFVDGLEVTYPVRITASDALPVDLPPLFMEPKYSDQLTALANDALNTLTQRINNWLLACQESDDKLTLWRHMSAHRACSELRYQTLRLLNTLEPHFQHTKFDYQSPRVDKFFSFIVKCLDLGQSIGNIRELYTSRSDNPVVSLCSDPEHCLSNLRHLVLRLLQKLLPQLVLPKSFDFESDLVPLIDTACACNLNA